MIVADASLLLDPRRATSLGRGGSGHDEEADRVRLV
ncbi:MAG: hypothetical protein AVDCRST_MAG53-2769 [uncultured Solirubrobacteraceae bacterium]|uniref:Uncharacterized protein n=1 Tax=uncultured Solirubrobacteraceae bacterium TaxID=1162706 RepID=A0A6J4SYA2_9ACTN|nr:MAG: hypothetical protein AVDCRST_MAG53-2769 [uncultured Solirubrobacteraceae bacterium]